MHGIVPDPRTCVHVRKLTIPERLFRLPYMRSARDDRTMRAVTRDEALRLQAGGAQYAYMCTR
jgi:hypothetical protein